MKKAFTLAEVLITLGIIGIVAALTMPALISNYKKQETGVRLKKFYSSMSQAIKLSEADNGEIENWEFTQNATNENDTKEFFLKYLAPYLKYTNIELRTEEDIIGYTGEVTRYVISFLDGTTAMLHSGGCFDMEFDTNGYRRKPNRYGYDKFVILICVPRNNSFCGVNKHFCTYFFAEQPTREIALDKCKESRLYCSTLLLYDNWEFKDDYPYKL
ncbi:MAG: type II secretion system GspH family protein [Heliobacteriaceae bacterium]|jgi:prepilin-type N-terminal cleavage/methylation domain-containing protein|nr:type II secretion system GspH family protein [Heliobacteriaceae bacterium]